MSDLIVVLTYDRPEMLAVCLECIDQADPTGMRIWVSEDLHLNKPKDTKISCELLDVVCNTPLQVEFSGVLSSGPFNGLNTWANLVKAYQTDAEYVYLILDDVFVTPDFFQWSRLIHETFNPIVSVGSKLRKGHADYNGCLKSNQVFSDWGVCVRRENLAKLLPLADEPRAFDEVVHTWLIANREKAVSPMLARAVHAGWYGTNQSGVRPTGTLQERIDRVRDKVPLINPVPADAPYIAEEDGLA